MKKYLVLLVILAGCASKSANNNDLASIQLLDRNGFSETVSTKDRLGTFEKNDFLSPQPYKKVVRVYGKSSLGGTSSKVTTYHANGQPWQYLEVQNGRAHGKFIEWHPNGKIKIEAFVIEGTPDVSEIAQLTWFFDGLSSVFDENGNLIAKITYEKGLLEGTSYYYDSIGALIKEIPYLKDQIHGLALSYWSPDLLKSREEYQNGALLTGEYFENTGKLVSKIENGKGKQALFQEANLASLIEYHDGVVEGNIENFDEDGNLFSTYQIKDEKKVGEEWEYYPSKQPKLCLVWEDDILEGAAKTWYENGALESERQLHNNQKNGPALAWYQDGTLMFVEEYEADQLVKGSYFKKWQKSPISQVENGKGIATLFDKEGKFLKKITYIKGVPQTD